MLETMMKIWCECVLFNFFSFAFSRPKESLERVNYVIVMYLYIPFDKIMCYLIMHFYFLVAVYNIFIRHFFVAREQPFNCMGFTII